MKNQMVRIFLLFTFFTVLYSCKSTDVYFDEIQPKKGLKLRSIPTEIQGMWIDSNIRSNISSDYNCMLIFDNLKLNTSSESFNFWEKDSLGNWQEMLNFTLSDSVVLQQSGNFCVLNYQLKRHELKERETPWSVLIISPQLNGDIIWYRPNLAPFFGKNCHLHVKQVEKTYAKKYINDSTSYERKPLYKKSLKESKRVDYIDGVYYSGQFRYKDIKKILLPGNIFFTLKKDGSIEGTPENPNKLFTEEVEEEDFK